MVEPTLEQLGGVVVLRHNHRVMTAISSTQRPLGKDCPHSMHLNASLYASLCTVFMMKSSASSYAVTESMSLCLIRLRTNNFRSLTPRTKDSHVENLKNLSDPILWFLIIYLDLAAGNLWSYLTIAVLFHQWKTQLRF